MPSPEDVQNRLAWAQLELDRHRPVGAFGILRDLWTQLDPADQSKLGRPLLEKMFRIAVRYLGDDASETEEAAQALADLGHLVAAKQLGLIKSLQSRALIRAGKTEDGWLRAREGEAILEGLVERAGYDPDLWGTLGGLKIRMSHWAQESDPAGSDWLESQAIRAYKEGWRRGPDAYPALNYLERRAIRLCRQVETRELFLHNSALWRHPTNEIDALDNEEERLRTALSVRRLQVERREALPWSAFDVARGQHYLRPNVNRFLEELEFAVKETFRVARTSQDRWMVKSAADSLSNLARARVPIDGLDLASAYLNEVHESPSWEAGNWDTMGAPQRFLQDELAEARQEIKTLLAGALSEPQRDLLEQMMERSHQAWTAREEERFQAELKELRKTWEPPQKKWARLFGRLIVDVPLAKVIGTFNPVAGTVLAVVQAALKYQQKKDA